MAAVGLPCWTPAVWADTVWTLGVWRDETTPPPPPPPEEDAQSLSGGWLTPQQIARLRGWQAPPRRQEEPYDEATSPEDLRHAGPAPGAVSPPDAGAHDGAAAADTRFALLKTARAVPPLDWAPMLTLAQADATRRQALAAQAEEEEVLVLMLMLEGLW